MKSDEVLKLCVLRFLAASCVLALVSVWSLVVRAQNDPEIEACASQRHVSIAFAAELDPELQREVLADLRSELASRRLTVCLAAESPADAALAEVRVEDRGSLRIAIDVFDRTTDKRVGRDLALSSVPPNGRALAVAIAIDELLRASWAELALRSGRTEHERAAEPKPKPKPQMEATIASAPPRRSEAAVEHRVRSTIALSFGVEATYARSFDQYDAFGAVAVADLLTKHQLWLDARAGFSSALKRKVSEGAVAVSGPLGALTVGACLPQGRGALRLCLGLRTGLELLTFTGDSDTDIQGKSSLHTVITSVAVGQARFRLYRPLFVVLGAGAGTALLGARVTNGSQTLSRIDGLMVQGSLGLGVTR